MRRRWSQSNEGAGMPVIGLMIGLAMLVGCGDSGNYEYDGPNGPHGQRGTFDVTLSGAVSEKLSHGTEGGASYNLNAPAGYCGAAIGDVRSDGMYAILLYYKGQSCPGEGSYDVAAGQNAAAAGQFWGTLTVNVGDMMPALYRAETGSVEVTSREEQWIIGKLAIDFVGMVDATQEVRAEGEFAIWSDGFHLE